MARITELKKTKATVVSGDVKSIADDRMSYVLKTQTYNRTNKKYEDVDIDVHCSTPVNENMVVGSKVTSVGAYVPDMQNFGETQYFAYESLLEGQSYEHGTLAVVTGEVMFARYNEEVDENGQHRMTKPINNADGTVTPSKPRSPHFDVAVQTVEPDENGKSQRVLHIIKQYPIKGDMTTIDRYRKLFEGYNHKDAPKFASVITQPGQLYTTKKVVGDREYINTSCNHMGIVSIDVTPVKAKERTNDAPAKEEPSPAPEVKESAPVASSGFTSMAMEEDDLDGIFVE